MQWFEDEVRNLENRKNSLPVSPRIIFYGSSSITLWETLEQDFQEFIPLNLGFGGSTLGACTWFFDRIVSPYNVEGIILYAGDNDLGDGRHPEEVFIFYKMLTVKINERYGDIPIGYISIKPSISRWNIIDKIKYTNKLIEDDIAKGNKNIHFINIFPKMLEDNGYPKNVYFQQDGLHLSKEGYRLWQEEILSHSSTFIK